MSIYIAIDLKSFYASVECVERGFDPLKTNLVVADASRTEKTICLAVSPSLKAYGIAGRARLFEVVSKVKEINLERKKKIRGNFKKESYFDEEVQNDPYIGLSYYVAPPRMATYMKYSSQIYNVYLRYIAPEDIHVYSIDEVFIDATAYLNTYKMTAHELAMKMIKEVLKETGITATAGIGPNLYLCKIAMDIVAKKMKADKDGVRIAEIDEISYRQQLWDHQPLTDFWRIGRGITKRLNDNGMYTLGDVAMMSLTNEDKLFKIFGINAELIIDHAWGYEPVTMKEIKMYRPSTNSLSTGQVLTKPYPFNHALTVIKEMADHLSLDMVDKKVLTSQLILIVGYDISSLENYNGEIMTDVYGRQLPKFARATCNLSCMTNSSKLFVEAISTGFKSCVDPKLKIRRLNIAACNLIREDQYQEDKTSRQTNIFEDILETEKKEAEFKKSLEKENKMQQAILKVQKKYGKNAILRLNNLEEGATAIERNKQIGGHKA